MSKSQALITLALLFAAGFILTASTFKQLVEKHFENDDREKIKSTFFNCLTFGFVSIAAISTLVLALINRV